jgi:hypothetical protein
MRPAESFLQGGITSHGTDVAHGGLQGFFLAYEHDEAATASDSCVNEISLKQKVLLHCEWHDDDGKL